jgi:hypothetical protein
MRGFRFLLLVVLMIGLPLKGLASASSLFCAPFNHHPAPAVAAHGDHRHAAPLHDRADHAEHDRRGHEPTWNDHAGHDHGAHASGGLHAHQASAASAGGLDFGDEKHCSTCATCGAHAVADSPVAVAPQPLAPWRDAIPFESAYHGGLFPSALERPPKSPLA